MRLKDCVFVEKYRPKSIADIAGKSKTFLSSYLEKNELLPHFLFYSTFPGTGKTSLAKAFVNDLGCDILLLNSSDERKIDVVREKVKMFASSVSSKQGKKKCIFLDEADGLTRQSQDALRNVMETYSKNCFFILSCNYINKIIDPLKSRCILVDFSKCFNKKEVCSYISKIVQEESLNELGVNDEVVEKVVEMYRPNVRNMVMFLQRVKVSGAEVVGEILNKDVYDSFWDLFKEKKFASIGKLLAENDLDVELINKWLFDKAIENSKELGVKRLIKTIRIIAENERDFVSGADKNLIFRCGIFSMMIG